MKMFDNIKQKLENNAQYIDQALSEYFFDDSAESPILNQAQRYSLMGGGKKIRAFLVLEICRLLGGETRTATPYACAIEMIHASSLIHDDMPCMDNDDFRRGKPSTHKEFGESAALLSGDSLMIKAFMAISSNHIQASELNLKAVSILASSSGDEGMLAGQGIDILSPEKIQSLDSLIHLHNLKTGKLIVASAKIGCLAAGVLEDDYRYKLAVKYAENIGLAFQIVDDLLDYKEGKIEEHSFISFMTYEEAINYANNLTSEAIESIRIMDDGTLEELARYLTVREY